MNDLNHVALIGRLTRDFGTDARAFGYLPNGTARASVSIAVNRSKKNADGGWEDEASFFDVTIWGKTAENLKPYLTKGKQIAVEGVLKQERWQDRETGANRSRVVVNAVSVQLLGGRQDADGGGQDFWPQRTDDGARGENWKQERLVGLAPQKNPPAPQPYPDGFADEVPF